MEDEKIGGHDPDDYFYEDGEVNEHTDGTEQTYLRIKDSQPPTQDIDEIYGGPKEINIPFPGSIKSFLQRLIEKEDLGAYQEVVDGLVKRGFTFDNKNVDYDSYARGCHKTPKFSIKKAGDRIFEEVLSRGMRLRESRSDIERILNEENIPSSLPIELDNGRTINVPLSSMEYKNFSDYASFVLDSAGYSFDKFWEKKSEE